MDICRSVSLSLQDTISVHRPNFYAQRFLNFMATRVFKKVPTGKHPWQRDARLLTWDWWSLTDLPGWEMSVHLRSWERFSLTYLSLLFPLSLSLFLSVSLSFSLFLSVSLSVSICLSVCLSVCQSLSLFLSLSLSLSLSTLPFLPLSSSVFL